MHFMGQRRQANNHVVRSQVTLLRCSNKHLIVVPWRNGCSNWKESRTIQNWDLFRKKWVTVIHNSKTSHISWCPPPRAPFFPLPCWSSSFAAGFGSANQPHTGCRYRPWFSDQLPKNEIFKSCSPLEGSVFSSVLDAEAPSVFRRVEALKCWLRAEEGWLRRWPCLAVALRGAWSSQDAVVPWKMMRGMDACPHIRAASVCPDGCAA